MLVVERVIDRAKGGGAPRYETTLIERSLASAGHPPVRRRVTLPHWPPIAVSQPLLVPLGDDRAHAQPSSAPGDRHPVELQVEAQVEAQAPAERPGAFTAP